jgi:SAM-dependent methyltransferase
MALSVSDDLLRTMAAVPVESSVLDLGCGEGDHTEPLLRLGFPVHACDPRPDAVSATRERVTELIDAETAERCVGVATLEDFDYPDETFDWVIAYRAEVFGETSDDLRRLFETARRVLKGGGWLYVTVPAADADLDSEKRTSGDGAPVEANASDDPFTIAALDALREDVGLAEAKEAEVVREHDEARVHAIFRKVD